MPNVNLIERIDAVVGVGMLLVIILVWVGLYLLGVTVGQIRSWAGVACLWAICVLGMVVTAMGLKKKDGG